MVSAMLAMLPLASALLAPLSSPVRTPTRAAPTASEPEMCRALPWLERPAGLDSLKDADYAMYLQAGDFGFDPLGLKPTNPKDLKEMQTKEINNGRLAMIAAAGMVAQELATGQRLF